MKKLTKLFLSTAAILAMSAPVIISTAAAATMVKIASEKPDEQKRDVAAFSKIKLLGSLDATVTVGKKASVTVIAPKDLIKEIITEVKDDTLVIQYSKNMQEKHWKRKWNNETRIEITVPDLSGAMLYGSGDMTIEGGKGKEFYLILKGSGDALMKGTSYSNVSIDLKGSGDIDLEGKCDTIDINLMGSGDIDADALKCKDASVNLRGSGDINLYASASVKAGVQGSGDIVVYGNPKIVDSETRGSGEIRVKD